MQKWLGFGAALALVIAIAPTAVAASCDLAALKHYPMTDAIRTRSIPLWLPLVSFPGPGKPPEHPFDWGLDKEGEVKAKAALRRGLQTFKPVERPVMMLAASASWTEGGTGLAGFFVLEQSVYVDEVLATLDAEGLKAHAALIREGRALFGPDYGAQKERYYRWSDGSGTILDPVLDAALLEVSLRYRALPSLLTVAAARIEASPELTALYEPLREKATDDQRFSYLTKGLLACFDGHGPPADMRTELAALPPAYARIAVVYVFEAEMLNGSVEQFFFNSTGNVAPEVVEALTMMGLTKHAAAVQRGMDLFMQPYPRGLFTRRTFMRRQGEDFAKEMDVLTGMVDDGAIDPAMIRMAKEADILPK